MTLIIVFSNVGILHDFRFLFLENFELSPMLLDKQPSCFGFGGWLGGHLFSLVTQFNNLLNHLEGHLKFVVDCSCCWHFKVKIGNVVIED